MRSRNRCSMCPAIHIKSRSLLRPSSIHEPSDPPLRVVRTLVADGRPPPSRTDARRADSAARRRRRLAPASNTTNKHTRKGTNNGRAGRRPPPPHERAVGRSLSLANANELLPVAPRHRRRGEKRDPRHPRLATMIASPSSPIATAGEHPPACLPASRTPVDGPNDAVDGRA